MRKLVTLLILLAAAGGGAYYYYTVGKVQEKPQIVKTAISQGDLTEVVQSTGTLEALSASANHPGRNQRISPPGGAYGVPSRTRAPSPSSSRHSARRCSVSRE